MEKWRRRAQVNEKVANGERERGRRGTLFTNYRVRIDELPPFARRAGHIINRVVCAATCHSARRRGEFLTARLGERSGNFVKTICRADVLWNSCLVSPLSTSFSRSLSLSLPPSLFISPYLYRRETRRFATPGGNVLTARAYLHDTRRFSPQRERRRARTRHLNRVQMRLSSIYTINNIYRRIEERR